VALAGFVTLTIEGLAVGGERHSAAVAPQPYQRLAPAAPRTVVPVYRRSHESLKPIAERNLTRRGMLRTARVFPAIATQRAPQTIRPSEPSAERRGLLRKIAPNEKTGVVGIASRPSRRSAKHQDFVRLANGQTNNKSDQTYHYVRKTARHGDDRDRHPAAGSSAETIVGRQPRHENDHQFSGMASYYWEPQQVASGGKFDPTGMTCAHRTLPLGTHLRVSDPKTGRSVVVTVNDRGPFMQDRVLDLSLGAARALGMIDRGVMLVSANVL
jgi:rare lipoprotein A